MSESPSGSVDALALKEQVSPAQLKALTALLPYVHAKKGAASGKPETPAKPAGSKFATRQGPRLAAAGGRQV